MSNDSNKQPFLNEYGIDANQIESCKPDNNGGRGDVEHYNVVSTSGEYFNLSNDKGYTDATHPENNRPPSMTLDSTGENFTSTNSVNRT